MNEQIHHIGNISLLELRPIAFFCSSKCDGESVLNAYAWAREQCDLGTTVIRGFHTPIEKDVYDILARRDAKLIHCPARSLPKRLSKQQKELVAQNRLLILSPFAPDKQPRVTRQSASIRNQFVIKHSTSITVGHLHPQSSLAKDLKAQTWTPCQATTTPT